jgi:hypothetical protein
MSWRKRLAWELVKPRRSRILDVGVKAIAAVVIAWGFLVVVITFSAVAIAVLESWL